MLYHKDIPSQILHNFRVNVQFCLKPQKNLKNDFSWFKDQRNLARNEAVVYRILKEKLLALTSMAVDSRNF